MTTDNRKRVHNRRGATIMIVALIAVALLTSLAVVIDMSRMYTQKNDLQTAADAAALAGIIAQISDTSTTIDSAVSFGDKNTVLGKSISVAAADVKCGHWDDINHNYLGDSDHCGGTENAVTATVRDSARYIFPSLLGTGKQLAVMARAYAAYVGDQKCVKPWAIPYTLLTRTLQPANLDTLRNLDSTDARLLKTLTKAQRTFTVKIGSPPDQGNFGSLDIPDSNPNAPNGGASLYKWNIQNCNSSFYGPGDTIQTETGGKSGPTVQGVEDFCNQHGGFVKSTGDCLNDDGVTVGVPTKAALWSQATIKGNGSYAIIIRQIVAFVLENLDEKNGNIITGYFLPLQTGGAITTTVTTTQRPILVQ